ncbi:MAG: hypothetical protein Q8S00_26525 [Deltaproteobacteria bacterium]|nr:hypothetical protein [Deltaproteobacteria bacterium]
MLLEMPDIIWAHVETPTLQSKLGARSVGEAEKGTFYISISFLGRSLGRRLAVKPSAAAIRETHAAEP